MYFAANFDRVPNPVNIKYIWKTIFFLMKLNTNEPAQIK